MLKNKLQEVAQRNYRSLPIYTSTKEGPDHAPRFRASVTYNGHTYHSPAFCTSIKQAEIAAAEAALHALSHNSILANGPLTAQMEPVEVPSNSQNESKKVQKGDRKEEPSQQPDVLPISESGMANVLENSELKTETSKIAQASPLSFSSSRIQVVPLQGFSISATSGKGTEKLNTGNISSVHEISGNETNKEQAHKMAAGMLEERHRIEEVIQQSEGRIYSPQFMSVQMRPVEVPSNLQKESNEEQEGDKKEATLQQPEDVMAKVLPDSELSELKSDTSQIAQAPPLSFYSSRIHAVPPQAFSISEKSGKGTDNISSMPETSSNKANKGQTCNMAAGMLEERQCNEVVIQQSEGRPSTPHSMSDMHKNQLQDFATRGGFDLPCYSSIREGLPHAPRFKAAVKFNDETFESPGFFNTLRQAEHSAATVALKSLSEKGSSLDESSMYKSLLQEKAQKEGKPLPVYNTTRSGPSHMPDFKCTVKFDGMTFEGKYAKTKKQAEKNAASVLWSALKDCRRSFVSAQQMHDDKAKAPVCEPNDHVPVQVINHMKEETPRQTHCQISRLDLSTNLSAVSLLAPPEVFDMGSKKELVHTMTTSVLGNRDEDKVQQPCDRSSRTKHSSGTRIRVLPGMSSSNKPWVAVNLTASTMQIKNNAP